MAELGPDMLIDAYDELSLERADALIDGASAPQVRKAAVALAMP